MFFTYCISFSYIVLVLHIDQIPGSVVNYGISNTIVLERP